MHTAAEAKQPEVCSLQYGLRTAHLLLADIQSTDVQIKLGTQHTKFYQRLLEMVSLYT